MLLMVDVTFVQVLVGTGMGAGSLADWIITGSLVVLLRRKRSGFNRYVSTHLHTVSSDADTRGRNSR